MKKEFKESINHFAWMLHVSGSTTIPFLEDPSPDIDRAYRTFTDRIFRDILEDPEKAKLTCKPLKKELTKLMKEASEVMEFFKHKDYERWSIALVIFRKLEVVMDFLDDFQSQPIN